MKNIYPLNGFLEEAPFDKILFTGAIHFIPKNILEQFNQNGVIKVPLKISFSNSFVIQNLEKIYLSKQSEKKNMFDIEIPFFEGKHEVIFTGIGYNNEILFQKHF